MTEDENPFDFGAVLPDERQLRCPDCLHDAFSVYMVGQVVSFLRCLRCHTQLHPVTGEPVN